MGKTAEETNLTTVTIEETTEALTTEESTAEGLDADLSEEDFESLDGVSQEESTEAETTEEDGGDYTVTIAEAENGWVNFYDEDTDLPIVDTNTMKFDAGDKVSVYFVAYDEYYPESVTIKDKDGNVLDSMESSDACFEFTMPEMDVTVEGTFVYDGYGEEETDYSVVTEDVSSITLNTVWQGTFIVDCIHATVPLLGRVSGSWNGGVLNNRVVHCAWHRVTSPFKYSQTVYNNCNVVWAPGYNHIFWKYYHGLNPDTAYLSGSTSDNNYMQSMARELSWVTRGGESDNPDPSHSYEAYCYGSYGQTKDPDPWGCVYEYYESLSHTPTTSDFYLSGLSEGGNIWDGCSSVNGVLTTKTFVG